MWITAPVLAMSDNLTGVIAMSLTATVAIIWIIANRYRKVQEAAYNARLKQIMIERGLSAEEIERIITASPTRSHGRRPDYDDIEQRRRAM